MTTVGLYGNSTTGVVPAASGAESTGLYGNNVNFGGSYFEWFIFQQSDTQPTTPTGGSWSFTTNSGTPPTGWSNTPFASPTNKIWVSIALVNSKNANSLVWSAPGLFSYSSGLPILSGSAAPQPTDGQSDQLYIQTGTTPETIWFKQAGTWTRLTGSTLYVDTTSNQTIAGTKTFSSQIQGSISGTSSNVTGIVGIANGGTGSTTASGARTALGAAASGTNNDITSMTGVTGGIASPNYVQFNTAYSTALGVGQVGWDGNNTLGIGMAGGNVVQKIGEDLFYYIKASSGITKGQVIMFTGAVGASGVVTGAPATGVSDGSYIMGIAAEDIALNGFGLVQFQGTLKGFDTSAFSSGAILWYDPAVTGGLTATKPSAPNIKVQMAAVINSGTGGSGSVLIRVTPGSVLGGTDSNVLFGTLSNNDMIKYNSTAGYWQNIAGPAGAIVGTTDTQTLTNKTISGASNTLSNIGNSSLTNSSITINGSTVSLGGSTTVTATATNALTIGTGLSGTSYNGSTAVTIANTGVLSFSGGTTGLTPSTATTGAVTLAGTLAVANGGTGATTAAAAATNLGLGTGNSPSFTGLTLSGGTANGVPYLNASKVLTTGSALTFDGTALQVGATGYPFINPTGYYVDGGYAAWIAGTSRNGFSDMVFNVRSAEQMRLTSTGLGIGTSSVTSNFSASRLVQLVSASGRTAYETVVLDGTNNHRIAMFADNAGFVGFDTGSSSATYSGMSFRIEGSEKMLLNRSGNLGLGVTPSANSIAKAFEFQTGFNMFGYANLGYINANAYYNGGWLYKNTAAAGRYEVGDAHKWFTAPSGTAGNAISFTQAMTLDASGNLLVGGTSALQSAKITSYGSVAAQNGGVDGTFANAFVGVYSSNSNEHNAIQTAVSSAGTLSGFRFRASLGGGSSTTYPVLDLTRDQTIFYTANSERARIDSSGNLLVGTTSNTINANGFVVQSDGVTKVTSTNDPIFVNRRGSTGTLVNFYNDSVFKGSISTNGTSVSYNTSSDYRLKENIQPMTGALAKVVALKPCTYKWKADGSDGEGFIAHELAEVVPQCVTGEKDAVDAEGKPVYQGIDTSFLVATLTAAIQEQQAIIDSLKARLDAANL